MSNPLINRLRQATRGHMLPSQGYGMALLIVFLSSSILIASSAAILLAPAVTGTTGALVMDEATARQLAEEALDAAQSDILTKQAAGTTIDTSYRYPSSGTNTISVPTYPGSASSTSKGTYYVTATYARGFTFLLNATVTIGSNTESVSRLVQLNGVSDPYSNALAIYSMRKVKSSYAGYAAQVRCASNPSGATTQDIGFDADGDFDIAGLRTCLGDSTLPLDVTTGEKLAYGLRKLGSSYSGNAIKVRRSSDNTTQDIGFDADGNLDTVSLKSFVGSSSGYIHTWYDQSGSGKDVTQTTNAYQPRIVSAGILETADNAPTVYFDGNDYMQNTTLGGTLITGSNLTAFIVGKVSSITSSIYEFTTLHKTGGGYTYETTGAVDTFYFYDSWLYTMSDTDYATGSPSAMTSLFQVTSYASSSALKLYYKGTLLDNVSHSGTMSPGIVYLGIDGYGSGTGTDFLQGTISEVIYFNAALSDTNRTAIERSQGHYYNITGMQDGYVTTWYDQSGNGRSATQATTSSQPVVLMRGVVASNGTIKPGIQFDGSNDSLVTAASTAWPSGTADRTMNGVYKLNATGSTYSIFGWGSVSTGTYSGLLQDPTAGFWGFNADVKSGVTADSNYGHRITITKSGSTVTVYRDGTSTASGTPTLNTTANTVFNIGRTVGGSSYLNGNQAEIILYDTGLGSSQRSELETEQAAYFGQ